MTDESNALRRYTPFDIWFRYQNSAQQNEPLFCDYKAALAQIESLTRDVEKYQKRAFVTTGIIDTLRTEVESLTREKEKDRNTIDGIALENETLRAELDAAKEKCIGYISAWSDADDDALRYRWLRSTRHIQSPTGSLAGTAWDIWHHSHDDEETDAAIDAAKNHDENTARSRGETEETK